MAFLATRSLRQVAGASADPLLKGFRSMSTIPEITKVGVIGMGLMGHGIAQLSAEKGYQVVAVDSNEQGLNRGMDMVKFSLDKVASRNVEKGKMSQEDAQAHITETLARIETNTSAESVHDCDLVIEAIAEDMAIKNPLYELLGKSCKPETIIASNTSSFPVTKMGEACGRPSHMVGLHFFNPVQLMKLVEVVQTEHTDPLVFQAAFQYATSLGKTAVKCNDTPGFIVNRLLVPYLAQAMAMVDRGDATPEDIDTAMRLGAGHPMGPLQLADYVGMDTNLSILQGWKEEYPEEGAFIVPECLKQLNKEGKLGRKNGEGFYKWEGNKITSK